MIQSIIKELEIKSRNFKEAIETIYFGGGTPSIISDGEISKISYDTYVKDRLNVFIGESE